MWYADKHIRNSHTSFQEPTWSKIATVPFTRHLKLLNTYLTSIPWVIYRNVDIIVIIVIIIDQTWLTNKHLTFVSYHEIDRCFHFVALHSPIYHIWYTSKKQWHYYAIHYNRKNVDATLTFPPNTKSRHSILSNVYFNETDELLSQVFSCTFPDERSRWRTIILCQIYYPLGLFLNILFVNDNNLKNFKT